MRDLYCMATEGRSVWLAIRLSSCTKGAAASRQNFPRCHRTCDLHSHLSYNHIMSSAQAIPTRNGAHNRANSVSNSFDPKASFHSSSPTDVRSPASSFGGQNRAAAAKTLKPFHTQDIKVLLLENVNLIGQQMLKDQGYQVEALKSSLPEEQLIERIK